MSKKQIDKLPGEDSLVEGLERVHQAERERLRRALARELGRPLQEWEAEFLDKYLEKVGEELDRYIVYGERVSK